MSPYYTDVYQLLGLDDRLNRLASGEFGLPLDSMYAPFDCYGFPPALIPLWSDSTGPKYAGLWKHWFVPRQDTFVECYVDEGFKVEEVARTPEQLLEWLLFYSLYVDEDGEAEFQDFAAKAGVQDYTAIRAIIETKGYDLSHLQMLPAFRDNPPLQSCLLPTQYRGDFPSEWMPFDNDHLRLVCSLELSTRIQKLVAKATGMTPWLANEKQIDVFEELLRSGDLGGAWLSLNTSGWLFSEAKKAIRQLADKASDDVFGIVAEAWVAQPHESRGGY
jgi:hypothetical protein